MNRFAYIFPGQGSQHPGMGRELCEAFPESKEVFDIADAALGEGLSETCFSGSEQALALTENTQPAILTVSVAALRALESHGLRPAATAGHSLGEYSAHVAAGTMEFATAVKTVRKRGQFMQRAVPVGEGAMAAILGLDPARVEALCAEAAAGEIVSPANFNSPGQIVVAGHAGAVERVIEAAQSAGARRAVRLPVSAPFHCGLMQPAARELASVLAAVRFQDPSIPVYANVDARPVTAGDRACQALLEQVASPVLWHQTVAAMVADGIETFVEVGPGKVLAGLVRRIHRAARVFSVSDPTGVQRLVDELGDG